MKKGWLISFCLVIAAVIVSFVVVTGRRSSGADGKEAQQNINTQTEEALSENVMQTEEETDLLSVSEENGKEEEKEEEKEETDKTGESENQTEQISEEEEMIHSPIEDIVDNYLEQRLVNGEKWAVSIEDLSTGTVYGYNEAERLQSASVIKVFIMGAVYDRIIEPDSEDKRIVCSLSEDEVKNLISQMITVSDNDCANRLVELLGEGSFDEGAAVVDAFCAEHGYQQTHMGRRFLASNPADDNYISADDCRSILSDIYNKRLVSEEASIQMEIYLQGQTRKNKIPAGLPAGFSSANKTGEMPEGYGLGCIENDMAIVYTPYGDYILVVVSGDLGGQNAEAISLISQISSFTAQWYVSGRGQGEETAEA